MTKKRVVVKVKGKLSRRDALGLILGGLVTTAVTYKLAQDPLDKLVEKLYTASEHKPHKKAQESILEGYYVQFSANLNKEYAVHNKDLLRKLGFPNTIIAKEKIKEKTYYKTLIGAYHNQEAALRIGNEILKTKRLVNLLGYPEINVIKINYEKGTLKTDWSNTILIREEVELKDKQHLRKYGEKKVETKLGRKSIDELIELVVSEWNKNNNLKYKLSTDLIRAIVWVESAYNPNREGYKLERIANGKFKYKTDKNGNKILTAYGLMQVTKLAAKEMGYDFKEVIKDPLTNLRAGVAYFGKYYNFFEGDVDKALGAYNAGPGRAKANKHLNFAETRQYIKKVNAQRKFYESQKP